MQQVRQRSSSMELLRIFSMLMIIIFHIYLHNIIPQVSQIDEVYPYFGQPVFSPRIALLSFFRTFGPTGNDLFILISGFFMVSRAPSTIDLENVSKKLLFQLGFGTVVLCVVSMVCSLFITETFIPVITDGFFNTDLWFIGYYLLIIVFAKTFLNGYLQKISQKQYRMLLLVSFALLQFEWSGRFIDGFSNKFTDYLIGLFLYALGGYIKRYNPFGKIKLRFAVLLIVLLYVSLMLSVYNQTQTALQRLLWNNEAFEHPIRSFANSSLIIILISVSWFELFRRIPVFSSKIINFLGKATFMAYIIHENSFFHALWDLTNWRTFFYDAPRLFYMSLFKWTVISFLAGVVVYTIYLGAGKLLRKYGHIFLKEGPCESVANK